MYEAQALHGQTIDALSAKLVEFFSKTPLSPDVRACILGRSLIVLADPDMVVASYEVERGSFPAKGDRVLEDNGSVGTVVSLLSLTEAVVKWDHEARARRSELAFMQVIPKDGETPK